MNIRGIHHVSAITANASANYDFYTKVLGMRLVKKTVNQDDPSMYHLFYADGAGSPGTDLTFFEIKRAGHTYPGSQSISTTSLRVSTDKSLNYWQERLDQYEVERGSIEELAGRKELTFRDPEGQRLKLVSDEFNQGVPGGIPWSKGPVPIQHGILGLGPVHLTVTDAALTKAVLMETLGFRELEHTEPYWHALETGEGGNGARVYVEEQPDWKREKPGRGSVHHVAFRVEDEQELERWKAKIQDAGFPNSGIVDRYYFKSLYFRDPNHILFELATDGPGFDTDEDKEHLGETLALPPFLEEKRREIEDRLTPLYTSNPK